MTQSLWSKNHSLWSRHASTGCEHYTTMNISDIKFCNFTLLYFYLFMYLRLLARYSFSITLINTTLNRFAPSVSGS